MLTDTRLGRQCQSVAPTPRRLCSIIARKWLMFPPTQESESTSDCTVAFRYDP